MNYYPNEWKKSEVIIIPKPGKTDMKSYKSYRPICLNSNISKIFEKIINSKLIKLYEDSNLLNNRQHGFRRSRSTISALNEIVKIALEHKNKEYTAIIAVDISGAFDNAWWPMVLKRLDEDNSFLNNRRVRFRYSSNETHKKLSKGCPQGGPISPTIWNIILNDLLNNYSESNSEIIAYADDITVICWGNNLTELRNTTGKVMGRILDWCGNNKLTVSEEKTKILYLFNSKIAAKIPNTITANRVEKLKIMGITFKNHRNKNKLDFVPHIDEIITKTNRASGYLIGLTGKAWGLDTMLLLHSLQPVSHFLIGTLLYDPKATSHQSEINGLSKDSYAEVAKNKDYLLTQKVRQNTKEQTIIITANENQAISQVQQKVNEGIKFLRQEGNNTRINRIINTRKGTILKLPNDQNIDQLIENFKKLDKINQISKIYKPKLRDPTILVKLISKITDLTNLVTIICEMNPELAGLNNEIKVLFPIKSVKSEQDVVLRVSPGAYAIIKKLGKIYTDIQRCDFRDKVLVDQCQNCNLFHPGHRTRNCPNIKKCVKCGMEGQHHCSEIIRCSNCCKHPYFKNGNLDHKPNTQACPIYEREIKNTMQRTDYSTIQEEENKN
ncbi:hypothetical protein LAZ67_1004682 [Cordylochernes scorpioides]|uniref:Reverse transcriptase domain-containing protein n=1 Tax=Cordylochernes scorpioides TaxID=51811 RepID=A0ABY6JXU3_9ARAC|nr:hypothetical protein LAZ67_1004682 [Cordylochernes scorpioides]